MPRIQLTDLPRHLQEQAYSQMSVKTAQSSVYDRQRAKKPLLTHDLPPNASSPSKPKKMRPKRTPKPKASHLEDKFLSLWQSAGGLPLIREYRPIPGRKFRADFALPQKHLLIEIEGGAWTGGRHVRPMGFLRDAEKYWLCWVYEWTVIRLTAPLLTPENVAMIVKRFCP